MAIRSQRGRTSFDMAPARLVEGAVAEGPRPIGRPVNYPERRAIWTLTWADDVGDGDYSATVRCDGYDDLVVALVVDGGELLDAAGDPYSPSIPVTDATELGDAWIVRLLELDGALEVVDTATNDAGEITIVFRTPGRTAAIVDVVAPDAVAQVVEFTVLGDPAGASQIGINASDFDVDPTGKTAEQVRDEFVTAIGAGSEPVTPSNGATTDTLRVTADAAGTAFAYDVTVVTAELITANVNVSGTAAQIQAPTGQPIPVGRFLVEAEIDGQVGVRLPEATDGAGDIAGVVCRSHTFPTRPDQTPADAGVPTIKTGDRITLLTRVTFACRNAGSVDAGTNGQVYVVIDDAGGPDFGQARADADGGNAVAPTMFAARWLEPTPSGELGLVRVHR